METLFLKFLFPPSLFFTAISLLTLASMANSGLAEEKGKNVPYSKFFGVGSRQASEASTIVLPSRAAMVMIYTPAFLIGVVSFVLFPDEGFRFLLLKSAVTIHFCKRVLERENLPAINMERSSTSIQGNYLETKQGGSFQEAA
ncbi:hypothetical protein PTKIN_Ptkin16aG0066700 [Pterospermum kingtungense]